MTDAAISSMRSSGSNRRQQWLLAGVLLWGALQAAWLVRGFFIHPEGEIHDTHERHTYLYRLVEFRALLGEGHWAPQWCGDFRGGLGSPYFSYYQPGFFYAASAVPWTVDPLMSLGIATWGFAMLGYGTMASQVGRVFGVTAGWLAGTLWLASVYAGTELYVRGDLSEFAGMSLLTVLVFSLVAYLQRGGPLRLAVAAAAGFSLVITHPCVALPGFATSIAIATGMSFRDRQWRRCAAAIAMLFIAGFSAAYYWMPVWREWRLVQSHLAFVDIYDYSQNFVNPLLFIAPYTRHTLIPFTLGGPTVLLLAANLVVALTCWSHWSSEQRRYLLTFGSIALASLTLMTPVGKPVWDVLPPLQALQFPWRLNVLLSACLPVLCVAFVALMPKGRSRTAVTATIVLVTCWVATPYSQRGQTICFTPIRSAEHIAEIEHFAPDAQDEWLPRGARNEFAGGTPVQPKATPGIGWSDFSQARARLSCHLDASQPGRLTLPHYHFVGWRARLDNTPMELERDADGLLVVVVKSSQQGRLEVKFEGTPARRAGAWMSGGGVILALALLFVVWRSDSVLAGKR